MRKYTVYEHVNKVNGKKYIGITCKDVEKRWGKDGGGYKCSTYFYNAIRKYGWNNFEHLIIEACLSKEDAKNLEIELILKYDTTNSSCGYNLTFGGQGNIPNSDVRLKMSKSQKIVWADNGYREKMISIRKEVGLTEEFKEKVSKNSKRAWLNKESRARRVAKLKENGQSLEFKIKMSIITTGDKNGFHGKCHSIESKRKMRDKKIGTYLGKNNPNAISIVQLDISGNYIKTFDTLTEACNQINASLSSICSCCKGKTKTSHGYKWMYQSEYNKLTLAL